MPANEELLKLISTLKQTYSFAIEALLNFESGLVEPQVPEDEAIQRLKTLPFKPAKFDTTGAIFSVGPNDIPSAVSDFLRTNESKYEDSEYSYRLSTKGWINRRKRD